MESKKTHADESGTRDFEKDICCCVSMCLKQNEVNIILEDDFIKQPFLTLYAKLKGNTNGLKKPHAHKSGTRDFEKEIFCCVSMCLKKEQMKPKSYWKRISSSNHF